MIKKWLAKIILWALDGRFVPVELLIQAREERDEADLDWARRYDGSVQYLQDQNSYYLNRAIVAEQALKISRVSEIRQTDSPVNQMIDIRVPKKVRK